MADDVSDVVWPRGIFEAKEDHHPKEREKLRSYFSMTANNNELYVRTQSACREACECRIAFMGLVFCTASGPIVTSGCCANT